MTNTPLRALIFDMDGTIVDNMGHHNQAWQKFFESRSMKMELDEIKKRTYGKNNREILGALYNALNDDDLMHLGEEKEMIYRQIYKPVMKPVDGLLEFLDEARRQNVPIALATAASKPNIDFVFDNLKLHSYFDAIVSANDVKRGKPHPDLFLAAAEKIDVEPNQCMVFEDALVGVEAAHRAEMHAIAITTTYEAHYFDSSPAVKKVISDFTELKVADVLS